MVLEIISDMRSSDHIVLFGPPGVGKSTVARSLAKYGYYCYEGDDDLLPEVRELNRHNKGLTEELREKQNELIIQRISRLIRLHPKLVVAYDFMWDRHRRKLVKLCPDMRWILLTANRDLLIKRIDRPGHLITPEFALLIINMFEKPTIAYKEITNDGSVEDTTAKIISR